MKNLLVGGCSFTAGCESWAGTVAQDLELQLTNLAQGAAGNQYIAASVMDAVCRNNFSADDTLIMVMWSGAGRRDMRVSGEYWHLIGDYKFKSSGDTPDSYWIFSGGRANSWQDHIETRKLFGPGYVSSDPFVLCRETLESMANLERFCVANRFKYKFMSYTNHWNSSVSSMANGDFSLAHYCTDIHSYVQPDGPAWIFASASKDCIYEVCASRNMLHNDGFHPSIQGQQYYAREVILPHLKESL